MDSMSVIRRLHQHRSWVNDKLLAACESLTNDQLRRPFAIGQGSIWKSLLHMLAAEYVWLAALQGDDDPLFPGDVPGRLPGNQQGEGTIASFAELKQQWAALKSRWDAALGELSPTALDQVVYKKSTSSGFGKRLGTSRADVLMHVCTHAQYTTAQVVNMLRQSGVKHLPDVMLISMARQEAACI